MKRTGFVLAAAFCAASLGTPVLAGDFHGAYVGLGLGAGFNAPDVPDWEGSAFLGYNYDFGNRMVLGGELDLSHNPDSLWGADVATTGTIDGRIGYLATDAFMIYGRAGGGYTTGGDGSMVWDLGAGAEYMLQNGLTFRGEFDRVDPVEAGMDNQLSGRLGVVMNF